MDLDELIRELEYIRDHHGNTGVTIRPEREPTAGDDPLNVHLQDDGVHITYL